MICAPAAGKLVGEQVATWDALADEQRIRELIRIARENRLAELTVEENGVTITVHITPPAQPVVVTAGCEAPHAVAEPPPREREAEQEEGTYEVKSPMAGVFYRAPSPESPPFVEVGSHVEAGDTIGLVEAMKVFNEIKAEVAGEVIALLVNNEDVVSAGQPLVRIRLAKQ